MRLFFEHRGIFFDPRRDGAFSSYYKDSQFSLALFFAVFKRQSILWKTAEFLFAWKYLTFALYLRVGYYSKTNNFKVFTVMKFGHKIVIFIRLNIRFQCVSYRRFPRSMWRKTRKRWFPWIFAQNKIICFSYRCGQYRGSELWKFGLFTVLFEKKTLNTNQKNQILYKLNRKNKTRQTLFEFSSSGRKPRVRRDGFLVSPRKKRRPKTSSSSTTEIKNTSQNDSPMQWECQKFIFKGQSR